MIDNPNSKSMHGYYLYCYTDLTTPVNAVSGVDQKIISQIKVLNQNGLNCEFIYCPAPKELFTKAISCLPMCSDGIKWPKIDSLRSPNYLYVRRPAVVGKELLFFLKQFKERNPESLVLYEVPSYPYDNEMEGLLSLALVKDKLYRRHLHKYVDYVIDLSGELEIFDIPTIQIFNGIELSRYSCKMPVASFEQINVISVAFFEKWHGLDRFICGMRDYYKRGGSRMMHLHVVGAGGALPELKKMAAEYNLQNKISFYGVLSGDKLSEVYDQCSCAIECLGIHRKGENQVSSSLKSREYLAKGIPFIGSSEIDVFADNSVDYYLKLPADESPINIEQFIKFHDKLYAQKDQLMLIKTIRSFAEQNISMSAAMKNVIDAIKARC